MPVTPEDLSIPRASLGAAANIEEAVNPALERIAAIMAPQDQGPWSTLPTATAARKGMRYYATDRKVEYLCTGTEWVEVSTRPTRGTVLPTSANSWDGMEFDLVASSSHGGICWRMVRQGTYWGFRGGAPLSAIENGFPTLSGFSWVNGIGVTVPRGGIYSITASCGIVGSGIINLVDVAVIHGASKLFQLDAVIQNTRQRDPSGSATVTITGTTPQNVYVATRNSSEAEDGVYVRTMSSISIVPVAFPVA